MFTSKTWGFICLTGFYGFFPIFGFDLLPDKYLPHYGVPFVIAGLIWVDMFPFSKYLVRGL